MSKVWTAGITAAAGYNLEQMVDTVAGDKSNKYILGRASVEFDGSAPKNRALSIPAPNGSQTLRRNNSGLYPIPLKNTNNQDIVTLLIDDK